MLARTTRGSSSKEQSLERTESWELEGRNHALIDGSFSFFAIKDFSYRGLERYGDDHTGFGFESRDACFCHHKGRRPGVRRSYRGASRCPSWRRRGRAARRGCCSSRRRCGWSARRCSLSAHGRGRPTGQCRCSQYRRRRGTRRLGTSRLVRLAEGRRHRGRCGDWSRECCDRCCLGWSGSRPGHVLVLHRPVPHAGILGLLPVTTQHASGHDAAPGNQADRPG